MSGVPRVYRTEALVLRGFDYGEADRILTLFTPAAGKLRAVAKGVRRTKSRMGGHLDLFTRTNLLIARGRQLDIITQVETIESFRPMRDDLWRSSYSHYVAELLDAFTAENLANYPLYSLAVQTFRRLATSEALPMVARAFEIALLGVVGYRPQLHRCLACDATIAPGDNHFSVEMGGVLCPHCGLEDRGSGPISVSALKLMRYLQARDPAALTTASVPEETLREVERRLQEYILYRLDRRPRSLAFLERLRAEGA